MAVTIKYIGTQDRWPELSVTGKQSVWRKGQTEERSDADATLLLATGMFSGTEVPLTFDAVTGVAKAGGSSVALGGSSLCYKDNTQHAVNTTATDQTLATITVPAAKISPDTIFEVWALWSCANSALSKTFKILLNGQEIMNLSQTTVMSLESVRQVRCRGAGSQIATNKATATPIGVTSSTGVLTLTADLSGGATFTFIGNRSNGADALALEAAMVKVL